jgi:hypothetical protein
MGRSGVDAKDVVVSSCTAHTRCEIFPADTAVGCERGAKARETFCALGFLLHSVKDLLEIGLVALEASCVFASLSNVGLVLCLDLLQRVLETL